MIELTKKNFDEEVLESEGLVFVDFWSESCVPCKALMPFVHEMSEKYKDDLKFCSLDITKGRRAAIKVGVLGLPAMLIFKDGEKIDELGKDDANEENIEAMIKRNINK